jgi:hypothetical protein
MTLYTDLLKIRADFEALCEKHKAEISRTVQTITQPSGFTVQYSMQSDLDGVSDYLNEALTTHDEVHSTESFDSSPSYEDQHRQTWRDVI